MRRKLLITLGILGIATMALAAMGYISATSFEVFNGAASATGTDISFALPSVEFTVYNDDADSSIRINPGSTGTTIDTDNYTDYFELKFGTNVTIRMITSACGLYSETGTALYRMIVSERE